MKNIDVVDKWLRFKEGKSGSMSTDGKELYSYALLIGDTDKEGLKVVFLHQSTVTTARHINLAKAYADKVYLDGIEVPNDLERGTIARLRRQHKKHRSFVKSCYQCQATKESNV